MSRLRGYRLGAAGLAMICIDPSPKKDRKTRLERMSVQRLRKKLLKKLAKRKLGNKLNESEKFHMQELIDEAGRRGLPTGLLEPVQVKRSYEEEKPDTYETVREHIKAKKFWPAVRILWKLRCNRKAAETVWKARKEGDWFTLTTLRYFDAAATDTFDSYDNAHHLVRFLNSSQVRAFFEEVVKRKKEFISWDSKLTEVEEQVKRFSLRNDIADARMKIYALKRKRKLLDSALAEAEQIGEGFPKCDALKQVAFAFAQSGLKKEALDIFRKAEDAIPEKRDSDGEMYDYLMSMKDLGSTMAEAGLVDEAYSLFRRTAESASPLRNHHYEDDGIGVIALIEIGLAQWKAGVNHIGVEITLRDVPGIMRSSIPNKHFVLTLRKRMAEAYAQMDFSKIDSTNIAAKEFGKIVNAIFCSLSKESKGTEKHQAYLEELVLLVATLTKVKMTHKAIEYFKIGIDSHGLGEFPRLLAKGHVAIGTALLKAGDEDRATISFNKAMCMKKEDPTFHTTDLLVQMGLAYAEAGLDPEARKMFKEATLEIAKLPSDVRSIADLNYIEKYVRAINNDEFLLGVERRIVYENLCVHASSIDNTYHSVNAYIAIAAGQKENGMHKDARATLKKARERVDSGGDNYALKELAWHQLAVAYADFGDLEEAKEHASMLVDKELFSKAVAAIVIAKAKRATEIDVEPLTKIESEMLSSESVSKRLLG